MTSPPTFDDDPRGVLLRDHTDRGTPVADPPRRGRGRPVAALALGAAGIAGLLALVVREGTGEVIAACRRAGFGVVLLVVAPAPGLLLHTLAWRGLLPPTARPSVLPAWRAFVAAEAGNQLGFGILGEPFKVLSLDPAQRHVGISVVALDNLAAAVALALFFTALGALVVPPETAGHRGVGLGVLAAAAILIGVALVASARGREIVRISLELLTKHPSRALGAVTLHLLGKLWLVAEMGLALAVLDATTLRGAVLLAFAWATGAAVGSPVPGQLGVVEGALLTVATAAGISPATALAIGLLRRLRTTTWSALGAAFAVSILRSTAPPIEAPSNPCTDSR